MPGLASLAASPGVRGWSPVSQSPVTPGLVIIRSLHHSRQIVPVTTPPVSPRSQSHFPVSLMRLLCVYETGTVVVN